jgi:hypothetical protein
MQTMDINRTDIHKTDIHQTDIRLEYQILGWIG